jgi:hypothetical protein
MSTTTPAPDVFFTSDPIVRFHRRITADLALAEMERAVLRLTRILEPQPSPRLRQERRSSRTGASRSH